MSFQDVGRKSKPTNRGGHAPSSSNRPAGVGVGGEDAAAGGGCEQLSDSIVQYQVSDELFFFTVKGKST
jgi:hypothetical protein